MWINRKFTRMLSLLCAVGIVCPCFAACSGGSANETPDLTKESETAAKETPDLANESETAAKDKPVSFDCSPLALKELFRYRFSDPENADVPFRMQGGCFDGTYFYLAFISHSAPKELAYIVVLDKNGQEDRRSGVLETGHSNSLSILKDGTILVSVGNSSTYHIVDKETLTVLQTKELEGRLFLSIDYCPETDTYAMLSDGWGKKLYQMNASLEVERAYMMKVENRSAGQNFFCTKDLLYSVRYKEVEGQFHNYLYMHGWNGELRGLYSLDVPGDMEAQSFSLDGNTAYIPCGNYNSECIVYMAELP